MPHYIENIGDTTMRFLETFRSDHYEDLSLRQWLALTPHELVRAHLRIDESVLEKIGPREGARPAPLREHDIDAGRPRAAVCRPRRRSAPQRAVPIGTGKGLREANCIWCQYGYAGCTALAASRPRHLLCGRAERQRPEVLAELLPRCARR